MSSSYKLSFLNNYRDFGLLLLRLGAGGVISLVHGYAKLIGGPSKWEAVGGAMGQFGINFFPVFWGFMAMASEFFGGLLLMLGLLHRWAAIFLTFTMIVAATTKITAEGLPAGAYPLVMVFVFASMIFLGPGKLSFDRS